MRLLFDKDTESGFQDTVRVFQWEDTNSRIVLDLPEGFVDMKEEKRKGNYPYEGRPEIILEDEKSQSELTLQFLDKEMKKEDTREAVKQIGELIGTVFHRYKRSPEYLFENDAIVIGWFLLLMDDMEKEHIKAVFSVEKKKIYNTIENGCYINNETLHFAKESLLDKFTVCLPDTFIQMPLELAQVKYPSEFRPQIIVTSLDLSINFGFSVFMHEVQTEQAKEQAIRIQGIIESEQQSIFYELEKLEKVSGYYFACTA